MKGLEHMNARLPDGGLMQDYDFGWMWAELGISDLCTGEPKTRPTQG